MVVKFSSQEEYDEMTSNNTVIVIFTAVWCAPCQVMKPHFDLFSKKYKSISFFQVDVDELDDVANKVGVAALPSFYVYQDSKIVDSLVGVSVKELEKLIKKYALVRVDYTEEKNH